MSSLFSSLSSLVGGGFKLPYNVGQQYETAWGNWTHFSATGKEDGKPASVFKIVADPEDRKLVVARNGVKRLKMVSGAFALNARGTYILACGDGRSDFARRSSSCATPTSCRSRRASRRRRAGRRCCTS